MTFFDILDKKKIEKNQSSWINQQQETIELCAVISFQPSQAQCVAAIKRKRVIEPSILSTSEWQKQEDGMGCAHGSHAGAGGQMEKPRAWTVFWKNLYEYEEIPEGPLV